MAQQLTCDICQAEPAVQMLTNVTTGDVLMMGAACLPVFYGQSVLQVTGAGEHKGPAGKCQACRRVHERMTTPVAPLDVQPAGPLPDEDPVTGDMVYPAPAAPPADGDQIPGQLTVGDAAAES